MASAKSAGLGSSLLAKVKASVNSTLQGASGTCASCRRESQSGVTRACRVCGTVYCGECKHLFMEKSDNPRLTKKNAWACKKASCRDKGAVAVVPSQRHSIVVDHRTSSTGSKRASMVLPSVKKLEGPACTACTRVVATSEQQQDLKGNIYHQDCLVCLGCKKSLTGGVAFKNMDGKLYCDTSRSGCYAKMTEVKPTRLNQAPDRESATGEITYTGVQSIIETIGADLEAAINGLIPRCEVGKVV